MACMQRWSCVVCKRETEKGLLGKERHARGVVGGSYTQVWNVRMYVCGKVVRLCGGHSGSLGLSQCGRHIRESWGLSWSIDSSRLSKRLQRRQGLAWFS